MRLCLCFLFAAVFVNAQEAETVEKKDLRESNDLTWQANQQLQEDDFVHAEADYRRAISKNSANTTAPYNLGNAYYKKQSYSEAFGRYKEAGTLSEEKGEKQKAYHNMGNVFMKNKDYPKAVEAYKEALRNNPTDEETRYNLALAKEMMKKDQENQKNDDQGEDENQKDEKQDQENQGENDKQNEGAQEDNQDEQKSDPGEEEDRNKQQDKEGDGEEKERQDQKPKDGNEKEQQKPRPNQLSPQQIENLLEAMQNEEKKVQEKMDAKKVKGPKQKTEKDW